LTGLPFTIREILAIQHSLHLRRRISTEQSIKIVPNAIIWAIPAMSNLTCGMA
jgi:hypothetical protein